MSKENILIKYGIVFIINVFFFNFLWICLSLEDKHFEDFLNIIWEKLINLA